MSTELEALVLAGSGALREASFTLARDFFRAALEKSECPDALAGLGEALFCLGDWGTAEETLKTAIQRSRESLPACYVQAVASMAELRLAQGWIEEAEELLEQVEGEASVAPLARSHLLRGRIAMAREMIERTLDAGGRDRPESGALLELLGEAELARGDNEKAAEIGRSLAELGRGRAWPLVGARGKRLLGHALSRLNGAPARPHIDEALSTFARLAMPYEAARTRHVLADALRESEPDFAEGEARAAQAIFHTLGANGDAAATAALLHHLAARSASGTSRKRL